MLNTALAILAFLLLAWHLARSTLNKRAERVRQRLAMLRGLESVVEEPLVEDRAAPDYPVLTGSFQGLPVQIRPVADTLAVRKLPCLWLQVTMPAPVEIAGTFDFMMRPAAATTFSNFDHLPHVIATPAGLPRDGMVRSDIANLAPPVAALAPGFALFGNPRMKELLVSPKGVRAVVQVGEADRAQYAVFRQAEFGTVGIDPALVGDIVAKLAGIVANLRRASGVAA